MTNNFESLSDHLNEQIDQTLQESGHQSGLLLRKMIAKAGGIDHLDADDKKFLVTTLEQIAQTKRGMKQEVRRQAKTLAVLIEQQPVLEQFRDASSEQGGVKKWLPRAALMALSAAGGATAAAMIGDANMKSAVDAAGNAAVETGNAAANMWANTPEWVIETGKYVGGGALAVGGLKIGSMALSKKNPERPSKRRKVSSAEQSRESIAPAPAQQPAPPEAHKSVEATPVALPAEESVLPKAIAVDTEPYKLVDEPLPARPRFDVDAGEEEGRTRTRTKGKKKKNRNRGHTGDGLGGVDPKVDPSRN